MRLQYFRYGDADDQGRFSFLRWLAAGQAVIAALVLSACSAPTTLESGGAIVTPKQERQQIGIALEDRLNEIDERKPIFSSRGRVTQNEILVLTRFAETLPSGSFVLGGSPTYLIEVKKREVRDGILPDSTMKIVTYTLALTHAKTKKRISASEQFGKCMDSEGGMTFPTRCSIMRPLILQRALEKL